MTASEIAENDSVLEDDESSDLIKPKTQPHLMPQDAKTVDPSKLTALTPEVVRRCRLIVLSLSPQVVKSCTLLSHTYAKF
jgi:hypothetical protein